LHPLRSKFIDCLAEAVEVAPIDQKQIARPIKGQTIRSNKSGGQGASHSVGSKFIDMTVAGAHYVAPIRDKQIARPVKGQANWPAQSGGKGGSHCPRGKF